MRVDLVWLESAATSLPPWGLGQARAAAATPWALAAVRPEPGADFVLFWDAVLGKPNESRILAAARTTGDVWHAGLRLGMVGLPRAIDFVDPVWRFNRDPDPDRPATSWRLSLRACLVRAVVLEQLGGPDPHFETLSGAALELGHRWIRRGAMMRHAPDLLPPDMPPATAPALSLNDEFRFIRLGYGRMWAAWAAGRLWRRGAGMIEVARAYRHPQPPAVTAAPFLHKPEASTRRPSLNGNGRAPSVATPTVSILIPTLERYPHLFNLLAQLREQTVRPLEIIVIDQTGMDGRDTIWPERFADLPLRVIWRDRAGQCSSRNAGLRLVNGDTVLFLDDDDEVTPDLIARHLAYMKRFAVDASCGVAEEVGAGALPPDFTLIRDSNVFPTNNTLLRTAALRDSGLFDMAFEKGERADHDLGMRLYLSGARLGLNPAASVVHLHAPRGGLREHKARVVTRSASRATFWTRHFLAPTEAYLWCRYFDGDQVNEALLIRAMGTLRGSRGGAGRLLRAAVMFVLLPDTWRQNRARLAQGRGLLRDYPAIPAFEPAAAEESVTL